MRARNLELKGFGGCAYQNVDLDAFCGQVMAVRGRNGSGKTALLLSLAGRMKPTGGTLEVAGFELPRQRRHVERQVGLSLFAGLNDLQESLTVTYAVSAEFELFGHRPGCAKVQDYLREWNLGGVARVRVKDLTALQRTELGIALAFAGEPKAVMVDDIENQLTMAQAQAVMDLLLHAARTRNAAVVVGVVERTLAAMADECIFLAKEGE